MNLQKQKKTLLLVCAALALPMVSQASNGADDSGIRFYGIVKTLPPGGSVGTWDVSGQTVWATGTTKIFGSPVVGSCVEVQGTPRADKSVDASKISTDDAARCAAPSPNPTPTPSPTPSKPSFYGAVQSLPPTGLAGVWVVSGKTVNVTTTTKIQQERGPVGVGSCVEVTGAAAADGSIIADAVEVQSGSGGCASSAENERMEVEFAGPVQALPATGTTGAWTVAGRTLRVTAATVIETRGAILTVGACVEVHGKFASDGVVDASSLKADDSCQAAGANAPSPGFVGTVQALPASGLIGDWRVATRVVHVSGQTLLDPNSKPFALTSCVEVSGTVLADGSIQASRVHGEDTERCGAGTPSTEGQFEVEGVVESKPGSGTTGDWKVSGKTIRVSPATVIDTEHAALIVGACVEVKGTMQSDGSLAATSLEARSSSGTCLLKGGVVSAASFSGSAVAPGQIVSIFGLSMGPATPALLHVSDDHVDTRLGNVRVLFNGVAAPLVMAASGQINAVVPFGIDDKKPVEVQVENNGVWSNAMTVTVAKAAPALFTATQDGRGHGAILNYDDSTGGYRSNDSQNPSHRGGVVVLYATGGGQMEPEIEDGRVVSGTSYPRPVQKVELLIGGKPAEVQYAGAAPGMVAGVLQINARIPDDSPTGDDVSIILKVGEHQSDDKVTLSIR